MQRQNNNNNNNNNGNTDILEMGFSVYAKNAKSKAKYYLKISISKWKSSILIFFFIYLFFGSEIASILHALVGLIWDQIYE